MTHNTGNQSSASPRPFRPRLYGLVILFVILLPMVIAWVMYQTGAGIPAATTNKGILLQPPVTVKNLVLNDGDRTLANLYPGEKKRWRMLVPITKNCDRFCAQALYLTRQVHIRLAEKAYRVERILLLLDELDSEALDNLQQQHPETRIVSTQRRDLEVWLGQTPLPDSPLQYFYLIDQQGFAMMRYDISHSGQDLLDDLKKLLKYTYDK